MREVIKLESSSIAPENESDHSQRGDVGGVSSMPHPSQENGSSSSYDEEDDEGSSEKEKKQSE